MTSWGSGPTGTRHTTASVVGSTMLRVRSVLLRTRSARAGVGTAQRGAELWAIAGWELAMPMRCAAPSHPAREGGTTRILLGELKSRLSVHLPREPSLPKLQLLRPRIPHLLDLP